MLLSLVSNLLQTSSESVLTPHPQQRAAYVVIMHAIRDPETQQKGIVGIAYNVGVHHSRGESILVRPN